MNIKNKNLIQLGTFVVVIFLATNVYARPGRWQEGPQGDENRGQRREHIEQLYQELGITPQQEQQLKEQRESHREQLKALGSQTRAKREDLRKALQEPEADEQKIQAIHNELKQLIIQKEDMRLEGIQNVKKILTYEQFIKFHEKMEEKMKKGKERFNKKRPERWMR